MSVSRTTEILENELNKYQTTVVSASQTRPGNNTAYTALDVVGTDAATNMQFSNIVTVAGNTVIITGVRLRLDVNAISAGQGAFRLHLYTSAPTAITDNLAFNLIVADRSKYLGYIDIDAVSDLGDTLYSEKNNINKQIKTVTTSIFGVLQTMAGFTPTASIVKTVTLTVLGV